MNQYLKALNNQRPLCFFDSFGECILEKQVLVSKEPRETMGTTETLHPQNTDKNSKGLSPRGAYLTLAILEVSGRQVGQPPCAEAKKKLSDL